MAKNFPWYFKRFDGFNIRFDEKMYSVDEHGRCSEIRCFTDKLWTPSSDYFITKEEAYARLKYPLYFGKENWTWVFHSPTKVEFWDCEEQIPGSNCTLDSMINRLCVGDPSIEVCTGVKTNTAIPMGSLKQGDRFVILDATDKYYIGRKYTFDYITMGVLHCKEASLTATNYVVALLSDGRWPKIFVHTSQFSDDVAYVIYTNERFGYTVTNSGIIEPLKNGCWTYERANDHVKNGYWRQVKVDSLD